MQTQHQESIARDVQRIASALEKIADNDADQDWPNCTVGGCPEQRAFGSALCFSHIKEAIARHEARKGEPKP